MRKMFVTSALVWMLYIILASIVVYGVYLVSMWPKLTSGYVPPEELRRCVATFAVGCS